MKGAMLDGWEGAKTDWDTSISPDKLFAIANRILRRNGKLILFSQEPYTSRLITEAIPNLPFSYRMIWEKDHFANSLIAKKAPVSFYEDILVFSKTHETVGEDLYKEYREWLKSCMDRSDVCWRDEAIHTKYMEEGVAGSIQSAKVIAKHKLDVGYNQIERINERHYKILEEFIDFDKSPQEVISLYNKSKRGTESIFNLWQGGKYKSNILRYKKDYDGYHPTQKPVALLEDLIQTYSNEGDLVVDLTMGSGSTGVAAANTGRRFIGIELSDEYFEIAKRRLNNAL